GTWSFKLVIHHLPNDNDHVAAANDSPLKKLSSAAHVHRLVRPFSLAAGIVKLRRSMLNQLAENPV
ncbi:hypothetical protein, partial [Roseiconus lacunae]